MRKRDNTSTKLSIIVAVDKNRGIGCKNQLLYDIPEDLKRFRRITLNHPVIMGYNTFLSIGKPLKDRINIVLHKDAKTKIEGAYVFDNLLKAIDFAKSKDNEEAFIIGGASVYAQTIDIADRLYLTLVDASKKADTFFPDYSQYKKIIYKKNIKSDKFNYQYLVLER